MREGAQGQGAVREKEHVYEGDFRLHIPFGIGELHELQVPICFRLIATLLRGATMSCAALNY